MKKNICLLYLLLAVHFINAQKQLPISKQKITDTSKHNMVFVDNGLQINTNIVLAPSISVFEKPNYQGRSSQFIKNGQGKFEFPFPLQHVSFKVPDGMIVYIKTCSEFGSENAYIKSQDDISLEGLCGVRTDEATQVTINFAGISTEIHNYDCMRFAGTIEVKMLETSPGEASVLSWMHSNYYDSATRRRVIGLSHTIFSWTTSQLTDSRYSPQYNNSGTIFNNNPVPQLTQSAHDYFNHTASKSIVSFYVGKAALREGRVKLWVKTDLTSAHKTCDLCDDFSSKVKMATPGYESIPLNKTYSDGKIVDAAHPYVVAGPYTAKGSRDGFAITASAGTVKNFRVHFIVRGL